MKYSGVDIQIKDFSKALRGYDINEVRDFLEQIARQIESVSYENRTLRDKLREKELQILEYRDRESMLKDTMYTAQIVTEDLKKDATREAAQILTQAKMKADTLIKQAQQDLKRTIDETNRIKKQKMELSSQLRATLETHLRLIDRLEQEENISIDINIPRQK